MKILCGPRQATKCTLNHRHPSRTQIKRIADRSCSDCLLCSSTFLGRRPGNIATEYLPDPTSTSPSFSTARRRAPRHGGTRSVLSRPFPRRERISLHRRPAQWTVLRTLRTRRVLLPALPARGTSDLRCLPEEPQDSVLVQCTGSLMPGFPAGKLCGAQGEAQSCALSECRIVHQSGTTGGMCLQRPHRPRRVKG